MQNRNKVGTSFRLSPAAIELIAKLSDKMGLSQASIVELSVRKMAEAEGIKADGKESKQDGE